MAPSISIIMSAYNAARYIRETIDSVLAQSFVDFEFIITEDCSKDNTLEILESYSDERIKIIRNPENRKLIASLNQMLDVASGKYIARMDADDICEPERLEMQFRLMEKRPEIVLCGTNATFIDEKSEEIAGGRSFFPIESDLEHDEIYWRLFFFENPFVHTSIMFRGDVVRQNNIHYCKEALHIEDFELWNRMKDLGKMYILSQSLIKYRILSSSITSNHNSEQIQRILALNSATIKAFLCIPGVPEAYCPHSSAVSGVKQVETVLSLYREYLKRFSISGDSAKKIKRDVISKLSRLLFYLLLRMNPDFLRVIKAVVKADIGVSINEFFFESLILGKGKVQNLFNRGREVKS